MTEKEKDNAPPPPIFDVVKKPELLAKFKADPALKQQVSTLSANPEFADAYDGVQRARRAHKGRKTDREARELAAKLWAENLSRSKADMARDIIDALANSDFKRYQQRPVEGWIQDLNPNRRRP